MLLRHPVPYPEIPLAAEGGSISCPKQSDQDSASAKTIMFSIDHSPRTKPLLFQTNNGRYGDHCIPCWLLNPDSPQCQQPLDSISQHESPYGPAFSLLDSAHLEPLFLDKLTATHVLSLGPALIARVGQLEGPQAKGALYTLIHEMLDSFPLGLPVGSLHLFPIRNHGIYIESPSLFFLRVSIDPWNQKLRHQGNLRVQIDMNPLRIWRGLNGLEYQARRSNVIPEGTPDPWGVLEAEIDIIMSITGWVESWLARAYQLLGVPPSITLRQGHHEPHRWFLLASAEKNS